MCWATDLISSLLDIASSQDVVSTSHTMYNVCIIDLPLSSFMLQLFLLTTQRVDLE